MPVRPAAHVAAGANGLSVAARIFDSTGCGDDLVQLRVLAHYPYLATGPIRSAIRRQCRAGRAQTNWLSPSAARLSRASADVARAACDTAPRRRNLRAGGIETSVYYASVSSGAEFSRHHPRVGGKVVARFSELCPTVADLRRHRAQDVRHLAASTRFLDRRSSPRTSRISGPLLTLIRARLSRDDLLQDAASGAQVSDGKLERQRPWCLNLSSAARGVALIVGISPYAGSPQRNGSRAQSLAVWLS